MANKLKMLLHFLVMAARDMLIGMIFGLTAAILLAKLNPFTESYVALLIPMGVAAGLLKGIAKFAALKAFSSLPTKGYRFDYPRFKLLFFWLVLLLGTLLYTYGLDIGRWFTGPQEILRGNTLTGSTGTGLWIILIIIVTVIGMVSYLYEPPYNKDEALPFTED